MINKKKLVIPKEVSGRPVTNRGVHLQPFGHHGDWLNEASYWVDLLVSMGMSWVVLLTDSDAVRQTHHGFNALKVLLEAGIIPIIREQGKFPRPFTDHDTFRWTVDLYGQYGLKPFWIIRNEPFDDREWIKHRVPSDAWDTVMKVWCQAAQFIASNGGYVGFPDGPCYDLNPFQKIKDYECQWIFDEGSGFYAGHHYGKNRPRDYPYDAVTRHGAQLTESAYQRLLDDYADDPAWREEPLELINQRRTELPSPGLSALEDDTCWRGWEKVAHWSLETFGYVVPMAMTEGGWVPRDRPGTGTNTDIRMPHTTPRMVAKKTLQMYDAASPFFAICPWLLADEDMGGSGWPFDAWHGWAYSEKYGRKKPVISLLQEIAPKEVRPRTEPMVLDLDGDTRDWQWVQEAYGAGYRRGATSLRLTEVHEYEGPAIFDVWVVDANGLPVEGVEFYFYHAEAAAIEGAKAATPEWYAQGELRTTGPDGRIHFTVPTSSPRARPGTGQMAIWPKGKGDILEKLGILEGTPNRHLNGLWQLVEGEDGLSPPTLQPESESEIEPEPSPEPEQPPAPPPPTGAQAEEGEVAGWEMSVQYQPTGPRILAGTLPRPSIDIVVTDPWGNASTVTSGSKPEHGPGGFEVLAPHAATYTVAFLGETFLVQTREGTTLLSFTDVAQPEPPSIPAPATATTPADEGTAKPEVEARHEPGTSAQPEPVVEAQPEPVAEAQPEPVLEAEPATESTEDTDRWMILLQKLERIEELVAKLAAKQDAEGD